MTYPISAAHCGMTLYYGQQYSRPTTPSCAHAAGTPTPTTEHTGSEHGGSAPSCSGPAPRETQGCGSSRPPEGSTGAGGCGHVVVPPIITPPPPPPPVDPGSGGGPSNV